MDSARCSGIPDNPKERQAKGTKILKKVAKLAKDTVGQSRQAFQSLRGAVAVKLKQKFCEQIELAQTILSQTEQKLQGIKSIPERIVSFHDSEARPIRKGKLNKAVEFGRTLQLVQDSMRFTGAIPATERNCFRWCGKRNAISA